MKTTIIIADDHPVVRMGLRTLLEREPDCRVVGEAADGVEAVRLARDLAPDVLILDLMMPGMNGMTVIGETARDTPSTRVIILSMHSDRSYVNEALRRGARGYVVKDCLADQIALAIRTVMSGSLFLADGLPEGPRDLFDLAALPDAGERLAELTAREKEIVSHIAQGQSNKEIAECLSISVRTVETHRARIMHKLGLKSHAALIHYAARNRLHLQA